MLRLSYSWTLALGNVVKQQLKGAKDIQEESGLYGFGVRARRTAIIVPAWSPPLM